jgi:hypothetical protein
MVSKLLNFKVFFKDFILFIEHRQPFSLFSAIKKAPHNLQTCGEVAEVMDKSIGRIVFLLKGNVSSKNYLSMANLDLVGPVLIFQMSLIEPLLSTFHIEIRTTTNLPLRMTFSTLYSSDSPTFFGRSIR